MLFSKTFGYAVRGVLYIALMQNEKKYVQVEEVSEKLDLPRHFMGKVLKNLAKEGIIDSYKGPSGGFTVNSSTLHVSLIRLIHITDGMTTFKSCVLRFTECNALNPCPLHFQVEGVKARLHELLTDTRIADLLSPNKTDFIKSISSEIEKGTKDQKPLSKEPV